MIQKFLRAKHWQIFGFTVGIPLLFQVFFILSLINGGDEFDEDIFTRYVVFIPLISIFFMAVFYGWMWSIGVGLQRKLLEELKMNVRFFKLAIFIPFIYLILIFGSLGFGLGLGVDVLEQNVNLVGTALVFIIPMHLFTVFCAFYQLYFVSKTIKTAELQRSVVFGDYIGEFFLIWFFPVGIWFIQPKINQLAAAYLHGHEDEDYTRHIL